MVAINSRLGWVTRVTAMRRDKAERAMAKSAAAHRLREEALQEARREEDQMQTQLDSAHQSFRSDPSNPQTQLWREIAKERRESARTETRERVELRNQSEQELDDAKSQFLRSNERHRISEEAVRKAKIQHRKMLEEKEADEMQGCSRPSQGGALK